MDEREVVQEFNGRRRRQRLSPIPPGRMAGQQAQQRANLLARVALKRLKLLIEPTHVVLHHPVEVVYGWVYLGAKHRFQFGLYGREHFGR